jgi:hypothetical protein
MKNKYFDEEEYYVNKLWFHYRGIICRGNGVLRWTPENGFHLVAKILAGTRPDRVEFRSIEIVKPLRIMFEIATTWGKTVAMTPLLNIRDSHLYFDQTFTINFGRAVFFSHINENPAMKEGWHGSGVYEVSQNLLLPDIIHKDTKLGDKPFGSSISRSGFDYEGKNGESLSGEIQDNKYIYFNWSLPKERWFKGNSWQFAEALQDALAIVSGSVVRLRYHEAYRGHRIAREFNASGDQRSLGIIFRFFDFDIIPKELVGHLALYLSEKCDGEFMIRKMYWQIVDAANQKSDAGKALLLSTVLEASLRTLYKLPYVSGRSSHEDPFKLSKILRQFQTEYLTGSHDSKWKKKIDVVIEAYKRLRHRSAHPDWITTQGGMMSDLEIEQSINDMILLSRFYGYMILAISGTKDLEPQFPVPFSNWKPIMTMETTSKKSKDEQY